MHEICSLCASFYASDTCSYVYHVRLCCPSMFDGIISLYPSKLEEYFPIFGTEGLNMNLFCNSRFFFSIIKQLSFYPSHDRTGSTEKQEAGK